MSSKKKGEAEVSRVYTVPLKRAWVAPKHRRAKKAVKFIREFAMKHMKSSEVRIDPELNEAIWSRGIQKPPRRVTVKMEKDRDGVVSVTLAAEK